MARSALSQGIYEQCVFHCQQALEKLLKAIGIERTASGSPRRTHDLVLLAQDAGLSIGESDMALLDRLTEQYMPTRYPDDPTEYTEDEAQAYLIETERTFAWLRQQLS
jgi:HEPN domain-containing protein